MKNSKVPKNARYYVGWIPREYAEKLLNRDGEFLVRKSEVGKGGSNFILSLKHNEHWHHYIIYYKNGKYSIRVRCFFVSFVC